MFGFDAFRPGESGLLVDAFGDHAGRPVQLLRSEADGGLGPHVVVLAHHVLDQQSRVTLQAAVAGPAGGGVFLAATLQLHADPLVLVDEVGHQPAHVVGQFRHEVPFGSGDGLSVACLPVGGRGARRGRAGPPLGARTDVIECLPFGLDGPIAPRSFRRVEAIPVQAACARRQSFDQVRDPGRVLAPVFESNHAAADLLARMGYAEPVEVHGDDLPLAVPGHGLEIETAVGFRALLERRGKRRAGLRLRLRQRPRSLWLDGLDAGDGCVCSIEVRPMQRNYSVRKSGRN